VGERGKLAKDTLGKTSKGAGGTRQAAEKGLARSGSLRWYLGCFQSTGKRECRGKHWREEHGGGQWGGRAMVAEQAPQKYESHLQEDGAIKGTARRGGVSSQKRMGASADRED